MGMKNFPARGDMYLVCLDPVMGSEIIKTRPALIISNDINNQFSETVTIVPITSSWECISTTSSYSDSCILNSHFDRGTGRMVARVLRRM